MSRIAIIGGGFSGALVLANLIENANDVFAVEWFNNTETLGIGVAYGTQNPEHLLNVRADRMGAFADNPAGFYEWLLSETGKEKTKELNAKIIIREGSFLPRMLYGAYLQDIVQQSLNAAKAKNIQVNIRQAQVTDAVLYHADTQQVMLTVDRGGVGQELLVDAVILATGHLSSKRMEFQSSMLNYRDRYLSNFWKEKTGILNIEQLSAMDEQAEIVIIGSGLSMTDAVLSLRKFGYRGHITAFSRNGKLPQPHGEASLYPVWDWVANPAHAPRSALGLLQGIRKEISKAAARGISWRAVIDSIRPITSQLWSQLPLSEKRCFMRRLFPLWNIHRHRMAPEIYQFLSEERQNGTLSLIPAHIYYMGEDNEKITIAYRKRGINTLDNLSADLVLNCAGIECDIGASHHPLLNNMRDRGLITIGPLRMGIELDVNGQIKGSAPDAVFAVGGLLIGEKLESTAVPELREQAKEVAEKLIHMMAKQKAEKLIAT